ncbi:hypothetical protein GCM10020001_027930 [Nonomuraea salmonea]
MLDGQDAHQHAGRDCADQDAQRGAAGEDRAQEEQDEEEEDERGDERSEETRETPRAGSKLNHKTPDPTEPPPHDHNLQPTPHPATPP